MQSNDIRVKFFNFFINRTHKVIPSTSLVPENDPSVLFNTAGMQPLVPYLLGQKHPMGNRLASIQKCIRTGDIDEVGDNRHLTFFEMMGNWSLGDYFKEESIKWSFDFLTSKEEGLGLDINRIYVTVFEGNSEVSFDEEAAKIWEKYISKDRIYFLPEKNNWWSAGDNGPCGPDTEIFYDINEIPLGDMTHDEFVDADNNGKVVEVWNNVFMQYEKKDGKIIGKLKENNIDTGMGLERIAMVSQKVDNVFETDLFEPIISKIAELSNLKYQNKIDQDYAENIKTMRIIADHLRTAVFMMSDGVLPSNNERGYILRRLLRRSIRSGHSLDMEHDYKILVELIDQKYGDTYPSIRLNKVNIISELEKEYKKFIEALKNGLKEFEKISLKKQDENLDNLIISGDQAFDLYQSYGFPIELTIEEAKSRNMIIDVEGFVLRLKEHQKLSKDSSVGMFKGGLANNNEKTIRLHTAHHLLLAGLQSVVDKNIKQRGSNITEERLRMDFVCDHKLSDEEKKKVEDWVNEKIKDELFVKRKEMSLVEAEKLGAEMEFGAKYPELVSVYFIEDKNGNPISKEFCGGPHVNNTKELVSFKITKEEAVAQGIRRIKAILE
jgi:alanyl-tRNA synthetase